MHRESLNRDILRCQGKYSHVIGRYPRRLSLIATARLQKPYLSPDFLELYCSHYSVFSYAQLEPGSLRNERDRHRQYGEVVIV